MPRWSVAVPGVVGQVSYLTSSSCGARISTPGPACESGTALCSGSTRERCAFGVARCPPAAQTFRVNGRANPRFELSAQTLRSRSSSAATWAHLLPGAHPSEQSMPKGCQTGNAHLPGPPVRRGDAFRGRAYCTDHLPSEAKRPACATSRGMRHPLCWQHFSRRVRHSRQLLLVARSPADGRMPYSTGRSTECLTPTYRVTSGGTCTRQAP